MARKLIVTVIRTDKPHTVDRFLPFTTNDADSLDIVLGEIKNLLQRDEAMLITILRDCHDHKVKTK